MRDCSIVSGEDEVDDCVGQECEDYKDLNDQPRDEETTTLSIASHVEENVCNQREDPVDDVGNAKCGSATSILKDVFQIKKIECGIGQKSHTNMYPMTTL